MSRTYAYLHGRFDLLEMALAKITDHADLPATLVTLGDYVDRGPDSRRIVERLMSGLNEEGWRLICLKGNHEDIMCRTCRGIAPDCDWWLTNGGGATLISYGQRIGDEADVTVIPDEVLSWIEQLPLMHVDDHAFSFMRASIRIPRWTSKIQTSFSGKSMMTTTIADTDAIMLYMVMTSTRTAPS